MHIAPWSSKYVVGEKAGKGNSAYMRPLEYQLQQEKASFSARMEPQWQPKEAAFSVGSNKDKGTSNEDKGTSNGIHEECKEFSRMFREKLQEFAMILIKKYHCNFLIEYFDDYHRSFNKKEFLKMEKPKEKSRWQEGDSVTVIEKLEEKIIPQDASTERLQGNNREAIDEVIEEAKANSLPRVASAWAEGFGSVPDQKFVGNGIALDQENLIEGPAIYTDIGAGILPPILDLPEAKSGNTCNIYPRPGQDCDGPHAIKEGPKYIAPLSLDPKKDESSLAGVKIGIRQPPMHVVAGKKLREVAEEVIFAFCSAERILTPSPTFSFDSSFSASFNPRFPKSARILIFHNAKSL